MSSIHFDGDAVIHFGQYLQINFPGFGNATIRQLVNSSEFGHWLFVNESQTSEHFHRWFNTSLTQTSLGSFQSHVAALPVDNDSTRGIGVVSTTSAITFVLMLMRLYSRWLVSDKLRLDDRLVWMAYVVYWIKELVYIWDCSSYNSGSHSWDLTISEYRHNLKVGYFLEISYYPMLFLVKMSILFFYTRVFLGINRRLLLACQIIGAIMLMGNVVAVVGLFQFAPFDWWNHLAGDEMEAVGVFDRYSFFLAVGYICIITDFVLLGLPLYILPKLQLHIREKILLAALFSVGTLSCILSILRLHSLKAYAESADWGYYAAKTATWSSGELHTAIICSCVPHLKPFYWKLRRIFILYILKEDLPRYSRDRYTGRGSRSSKASKYYTHTSMHSRGPSHSSSKHSRNFSHSSRGSRGLSRGNSLRRPGVPELMVTPPEERQLGHIKGDSRSRISVLIEEIETEHEQMEADRLQVPGRAHSREWRDGWDAYDTIMFHRDDSFEFVCSTAALIEGRQGADNGRMEIPPAPVPPRRHPGLNRRDDDCTTSRFIEMY